MNAHEAIDFIHSVSWLGSRPGLSRITELLRRMGSPERALRFIHIAGTNGKGSTAAMLASILTRAGYRTGLYTSPYIMRFNERMQIDGVPISDEELAAVTSFTAPLAVAMEDRPTEFELVTAIAFRWFAEKKCDFVVAEVGMGGRLDATNAIDSPLCSVITRIGLDHTEYLGDTAELIAAEKSGIVKPGRPCVLYKQEASVVSVVEKICRERSAPLILTQPEAIVPLSDTIDGQSFTYKGLQYSIPLLGRHQLLNAAAALECVKVISETSPVSYEAAALGLRSVVWPARFEIMSRSPWFIVDGGHNPQCAETVRDNLLKYFPGKKRVLLVGILRDKDVCGFTDIIDKAADAYVAVTPLSPRALPASELAQRLKKYKKPVTVCRSIPDGVAAAVSIAGNDGIACSAGSLYMAGAVRACFI